MPYKGTKDTKHHKGEQKLFFFVFRSDLCGEIKSERLYPLSVYQLKELVFYMYSCESFSAF